MRRSNRMIEMRGNPIMKQVAALQASMNQYDQVTNVLPQLSAEMSTLDWLYSVMNKGEGAMNAMNVNIPIRARVGGIDDGMPNGPSAPTFSIDERGNVTLMQSNEEMPQTRAGDAFQRNAPVKRKLFDEEEDMFVGETPGPEGMDPPPMQENEPEATENAEFFDATSGDGASTSSSSAKVIASIHNYKDIISALKQGKVDIIESLDMSHLNEQVTSKQGWASELQANIEAALSRRTDKKGKWGWF